MTSQIDLWVVVVTSWVGNLVIAIAGDRYIKNHINKAFDTFEKKIGIKKGEKNNGTSEVPQ
jgi:hypothetical protein